MQNHLVVMVRAPRLGAVKQRLAAGIGRVAAWHFYRGTTTALLRRLGNDPRWRLWLYVTPDQTRDLPPIWTRQATRCPQGRGDLGARMMKPMVELPPGPVVLIGSDIPAVTRPMIARAFAALGGHDAVFGPARDGGFWLVGLRRRPRLIDPFSGVAWSRSDTLARTLANLAAYRVARVDVLEDIDDAAAYHRL